MNLEQAMAQQALVLVVAAGGKITVTPDVIEKAAKLTLRKEFDQVTEAMVFTTEEEA